MYLGLIRKIPSTDVEKYQSLSFIADDSPIKLLQMPTMLTITIYCAFVISHTIATSDQVMAIPHYSTAIPLNVPKFPITFLRLRWVIVGRKHLLINTLIDRSFLFAYFDQALWAFNISIHIPYS